MGSSKSTIHADVRHVELQRGRRHQILPALAVVTSVRCNIPKISPEPYRKSLNTTATINILCINCSSSKDQNWDVTVLGKGFWGSVRAILARTAHMFTEGFLFGILTICPECCTDLDLYDHVEQKQEIANFTGKYNVPRTTTLGISHKEVEELLFSKVIVLHSIFSTPFRTTSADGQWKKWIRF